jgi:DHA3 family tetracycline resistance protein-like MFS transporter
MAQAVVGIGLTFISGAQEAWIADEVGPANAGRVFLRSAQGVQYARLLGIPAGVAAGLISLQVPILMGGLLFLLLAGFAALVMTEHRAAASNESPRPGFRETFTHGLRLVRNTPILVSLFGMVAFYETSGEVFLRLSVAHFLDIGLPAVGNFEPIVWFGIIRMASAVVGIGIVQYARARVDSTDHGTMALWLLRINLLQAASLLLFMSATNFAAGFVAYLAATSLSRAFQPIYMAVLNLHVDSSARATVISMSSQVDALGQSIGAPILGAVGSVASIRAALAGSVALLGPAIALNLRALRQNRRQQLVERNAHG